VRSQKLAFIIPYCNRREHLETLYPRLLPYLRKRHPDLGFGMSGSTGDPVGRHVVVDLRGAAAGAPAPIDDRPAPSA